MEADDEDDGDHDTTFPHFDSSSSSSVSSSLMEMIVNVLRNAEHPLSMMELHEAVFSSVAASDDESDDEEVCAESMCQIPFLFTAD